jgi:polyhydroxybutyrate depolymerase
MRPLRLLVLLLATLGAAGAGPRLEPGDHRLAVRHDGRTRRYLVHVPQAAASGRALPVLLSFHGAGGSAAGHQRFTQTDSLADREGFLVVYPEGTDSGGIRCWNAGTCCGPRVAGQVDDVGFALAVVDDLAGRVAVDRHRLYATGMSNGGMMAHRLAAEAATRVAAIAPIAGGLVLPGFAPARPVPVLHIHSLDDPIALYRGGLHGRLAGVERMNPNVDTMMARWAAADGCTSGPASPEVRAERRDGRGHTARLFSWTGCAGGSDVRLWQLTGAGHVWPGWPGQPGLRVLGAPTTVIDANEEVWKFVSRFRR